MTQGPASAAIRLFSRARFLGVVAGGGLLAFLGTRAVASMGSWRINTVERPRPLFDFSTYRLTIDGLVEHPVTLTYDELRALPAVRQVSDFHCVEGWGIDDVMWDGGRRRREKGRRRKAAWVTSWVGATRLIGAVPGAGSSAPSPPAAPHPALARCRTPPSVPSRPSVARPMKRPCSTTPVVAFRRRASVAGSSMAPQRAS